MEDPKEVFPTCILYAKAPLRTQTPRRFLEAPSSRNVTATASIWEPRKRPTCAARLFYRRRLGNLGQRICKGSRGSRGMVSFHKRITPNFAPKDVFKLPCLTGLSLDFPSNAYLPDRQTSGISPSLNKLTLALAAVPRSAFSSLKLLARYLPGASQWEAPKTPENAWRPAATRTVLCTKETSVGEVRQIRRKET
jgi:hypothetical protein